MKIHQQIENAVTVLKPLVEETIGPVPDFDLHSRACTPYERDMGVEGGPNDTLRLRYDPVEAARTFDSQYPGLVVDLIAHEIGHVASSDALARATNLTRSELQFKDRCDQSSQFDEYNHWLEGSAELVALVTLLRIFKQGKGTEIVQKVTGRGTEDSIAQQCGLVISEAIVTLAKEGLIDAPPANEHHTIDVLKLPVDPGKIITEYVDYLLRTHPDGYMPGQWGDVPYRIGLYRCAKAVSLGHVSLSDLFTHPFTDSQLEAITR